MSTLDTKENIRDLKNSLKLIKNFEPILYDTKNQKNIPGLVAEDVLKFYPELVKKSERGEIIGINYIQIISILISALKEMDYEMNQIKKEMKQLENKTIANNDSDLSFLKIFKK